MSDQLNRLRAEAAAMHAAASNPVRLKAIPRSSPAVSVAGTEEDMDDVFSIVSKQSFGGKSIECAHTAKTFGENSVHTARSHKSPESLRESSEKIMYATAEMKTDADGNKIPIYPILSC